MYLLDTNIIIYYMDDDNEDLIELIDSMDNDQIKLSSIVLAELEHGSQKSSHKQKKLNREKFLLLYENHETIDFDSHAAKEYGKIRADLERKGQVIGAYDFLIAAQALANDLTLITNNTKEFNRVQKLSLGNWY